MISQGRNRFPGGRAGSRTRPIRAVIALALFASLLDAGARLGSASAAIASVAVFPVENLSGGGIPDADIRQFLIDRLASAGVRVLEDEALEAFMTRHRVRYAAGIDIPTAEALRQEAGVDGVLIASVELSSQADPPKIALHARLVSLASAPAVAWADAAGLSGDDAPGLFGIGLVHDYQTLLARGLGRLSDSMIGYLKGGQAGTPPKAASKFRPKSFYRASAMTPGTDYTVAVVPFYNLSGRRNAGEILALLYARHLSAFPQFRVVDAGVVRRQLLDARVIMDGGMSLPDVDSVAALIDADLVLGGRVIRYEDYEGPAGRTSVEFSTMLIETKTRRMVWSSNSDNEGSDGVRFFGRGTSRSAHAMATQMVGLTAGMIAGRDR